jgi:hypothetical protein
MLLSAAAEFLFCRFQQFRKFGRFVGDRSIRAPLPVASSQQPAEFCLGDLGGWAERARPAEFCLGDLVGGLSEPALRIKKVAEIALVPHESKLPSHGSKRRQVHAQG